MSNTSCFSLQRRLGALVLHAPAVAAAAVLHRSRQKTNLLAASEGPLVVCSPSEAEARQTSPFLWFFVLFKNKLTGKLKTHNERAGSAGETGGERQAAVCECRRSKGAAETHLGNMGRFKDAVVNLQVAAESLRGHTYSSLCSTYSLPPTLRRASVVPRIRTFSIVVSGTRMRWSIMRATSHMTTVTLSMDFRV